MTENRIKFNNILQNQLPQYVREEFPLVAEFLKQYYVSKEFQSAPDDIIQNIDRYIKLDTIKSNQDSTELTQDVSFLDETIFVSSTIGFPDSYGLIQIDDEIITYTGKTNTSFTGCIRGFSGVTSYDNPNQQDELTFNSSESSDHSENTLVINLSSLFLKEFFDKIKYQLSPGFENREFYSGLDKYLFIKQSKDFYSTRGTDLSFKILFKALYGEDVKVIKPQDYLIKPSDAEYQITNDLVVLPVSGDPYDLVRSTLRQDEYNNIPTGYAPISKVQQITSKSNKSYYKISFDAGYNKDIGFDGSLYGNFSVHPKTRNIGEISSGADTIDVDSTVGFPSEGELSVTYADGTEGIITYTSKNLNQFFGCSNISNTILDASDIWLNVFAYGISNKNSNETIKVRITAVLRDTNIIGDTYYQGVGDNGIVKTLGVNDESVVYDNWFYNVSTIIDIDSVELVDSSNFTYSLTSKINHNFKLGDTLEITSSDSTKILSTVTRINSDTNFEISDQGTLGDVEVLYYSVRRILSKATSSSYSTISNQISNVQSVYKDGQKTLIAASSLPYYYETPLNPSNRSVTFNVGVGITDTFLIQNHGFYTGDSVYYTSSENIDDGSLFNNGVYFVYRVTKDKLKFSQSRSNLYNSIFIEVENILEVKNNKIQDVNLHSKNLSSQNILREISPTINDGNEYVTNSGHVGLLINGVEILNYKSSDKIYYGPIESIDIVSGGVNYDVINPPELVISDSVGTGATGYCSVLGSLQEIKIIDPGFDYLETPTIKISGGNGEGAKASASLKLIDHQVTFSSESKSNLVNISNDSIGFSTYHKFRNAEKIIYKTNGQQAIGGIVTNSSYYVSIPDLYTVKLHNTYDDALSGINTVSLTSYGKGNHVIEAYIKKSVISQINVEDSGSGYENKRRTTDTTGISTSLCQVNIKDHDFKSGEIITYSTTGSAIGGLQNNKNYYITKVDNDNFKLSTVGISTGNEDFYYKTKQYIQFSSFGTGTHTFNYPNISVEVIGKVGTYSTNDLLFKAQIQPIFRGEITSIHLKSGGIGYGSSEVINFNREPSIDLSSGSNAQLIPIINNGKIEEVFVNNPGQDYNSPPRLRILTAGNGSGAILTPIIEDGEIKSVKIVESGVSYDKNNTSIEVTSAGNGVKFSTKLKTWTINLFERYKNNFLNGLDDGFIYNNPRSKYGLQYSHLYAPRKLRESVYGKDSLGKTFYEFSDLKKVNGSEVNSDKHSPIIGWAYDGNPIYGPYGYEKKDGTGNIVQLKSGYSTKTGTNLLKNRPPLNIFPSGFFIEDYEFKNKDSENILDEYNGRFCITPEFPNGTYAYFSTFEETSSNNFSKYKLPKFPYIIGNKFRSKPNDFNYKRSSNQNDIDLNNTNWIRNTKPYNLLEKYSSYSYLSLPNSLNQTIDIKSISPGYVETIEIISGGNNYKVNDNIIFDNEGTGGFGLFSKVSRIAGKTINTISVASSSIFNTEIYKNGFETIVQSSSPHNLLNQDIVSISGLNTTSSLLNGFYNINVRSNTLAISSPSGISSSLTTGIVTFISVFGNISAVSVNDIYKVGDEKVKVLNIDKDSSRIRVLRGIDNTVGTSHSYTDILYEIPRRFSINSTIDLPHPSNKQIYFIPNESLGIGTVSGVGIGTTIKFSNPGVGITQIFIPTRSIYLPNHNLNTGDEIIYSSNGGTEISISIDGITSLSLQNDERLYAAKISNDLIGISTVKVGIGTTGSFVGIGSTLSSSRLLYLTGIGTGLYHSFTTNYQTLSGKVLKNIVTVSTAETHGLTNNDVVYMNVNPGISTTYVIKYNDYNRKLLVNPREFESTQVNIDTDLVNIPNHNFKNGQKVVYTQTSSFNGLTNNKIYYVVVYDENNIRLSSSYYSSKSLYPEIVGITSTHGGILSPINPQIKAYKDSTIVFDVSDPTLSYVTNSEIYSAFKLDFYQDSNFTQIFESTKKDDTFEVRREGIVGTSNAKVYLTINQDIPEKLYYKLNPIYNSTLPKVKQEINVDNEIEFNNQIEVVSSKYNGKHTIVSISSSSFTYSLPDIPEKNSYDSSSSLSYETTSLSAFGPISKIDISSKGQNYKNQPKFLNILSESGSNAILESFGKSIGKIKKTEINDIGFDFSSDFTVKPSLSLPQILKIEPLNSIESIRIEFNGRGYLVPPKLIVIDGFTEDVLSEVDLKYSLGDNYVTILNNTYRLNDVEPTILPLQNSNGVPIDTIEYDSITKDVIVTLAVGFSTGNTFPFVIGDEVLIESVSIGAGSTGKGYNSENYNYKLFTVTSTDENIGGIGSVTYNMSEFLGGGEEPGIFDASNSSAARIIPKKYFPTFKTTLSPNNFLEKESVKYVGESDILGLVENWDEKTKYLRVSSRKTLKEGKTIQGVSSKTQGIINSSYSTEAFFDVGSYSKVESGWITDTGILNTELQRIQDSFYYQNFSYSLSSRVPYDTWDNAVGSLNHTAGFKKFSDYQLESSSYAGIKTDTTRNVDVTVDIDGFGSLNCTYDFDLASENALFVGQNVISDEITFSSRILTDYYESVSNRVLTIDDISGQFNSNPRSTRYSIVHRFPLTDARAQKYVSYVNDRRFTKQRQVMIFTLLHDNVDGYLNQYGRVETVNELGTFDFTIEGNEGLILFYPQKYRVNDYNITTLSYNIKDDFTGIGSTNLGGIIDLYTKTTSSSSSQTNIVSIGKTYTSAKVLLEISSDDNQYQFDELNIVHDNTNIEFISYGQLTNHSVDSFSSSGLGTYYPYFSGDTLNIDFIPNPGIAASVSTIQVAISDNSRTGIGTFDLKYVRLEARTTSIGSSTSPVSTQVGKYLNSYYGSYFIVQISDLTNNRYQLSEVVVVDDGTNAYFTEYANIETYSTLGEIGAAKTTGYTELTFTPLPNIDVEVKVLSHTLTSYDSSNLPTQYNNNTLTSDYGIYYGTERDVRRSFELKHKGDPIFQKYFDASDSNIVSIGSSTIKIKNHFLTTGEKVIYTPGDISGISSAIGIGSTYFGVGIGTTNKLPSEVYVIKIDENTIKLARNAEDALRLIPKALEITSVGIGSSHLLTSIKQNAKSLIAIDNVIQSPVVGTSITSKLVSNLTIEEDLLYSSSVNEFFINDLIKIDDEIMRVESVGIGSTNAVRVVRPWVGTALSDHSSNSVITKLYGNYNIVDNILNFVDAPYGNIPLGTSTNPPDERDWTGISTSSSFHGRTFMRSGVEDSSNEAYYKNYIFDDISHQFTTGIGKTFTITSEGSNIEDISSENAVVLINEIFQEPGLNNNYSLSESGGIISISFVGSGTSLSTDINTSDFPSGGIIVSVGSTEGFGYQPLVSAGGTATVSIAGTISAISIGNSGSGYRTAIQTPSGITPVTVRVGVASTTVGVPSIEFIGTASVNNGNIVSIAITNPGTGYTSTNPPYVVIDQPLSYSDIPLIYSSSSIAGIGTKATVDIVVSQDSSVIDFEIKNLGYGYKVGDILTVPLSGIAGIPTVFNSTLSEFQITVQSIFNDKFSGWSLGELQVLDSIENLFDGRRSVFTLKNSTGQIVSIYAKKGSPITIQDTLLVFVNDILQIPGEGYIFNGGSKIQFTEPLKQGDTCKILFYKGSGEGVDVIFRDVIETVKPGDDLTLGYDSYIGQPSYLLEDPRVVTDILSIDTVETTPYFGPGNTPDENLKRPVVWCRQTEDTFINELDVTKDRMLYEPQIYPSTYLIKSVGIGSSVIFVESIRPFFNPLNENYSSLDFQNKVTFISQNERVSASATAVVSAAGTISSIVISDGGSGYLTAPKVSIQNPVGVGTTNTTAVSFITSGIVTSIVITGVTTGYSSENPPMVLVEPPSFEIEQTNVRTYSGDFGIISGIKTTSVGVASTGIIFEFAIPNDSYLRNSLVSSFTNVSGIQTGYYFTISNSNVGNGVTSLDSSGNIVGTSKSFLDGVYQVAAVSIAQTSVIGLGITDVARVTVSVSGYNGLSGIGYSSYYGNYSWGRIVLKSRSKQIEYDAYTNDGYVGISTGTILNRSVPLKYLNYSS